MSVFPSPEAIAAELQRFDARPVAFLEYGGTVFFARHETKPREPETAITRLIQGIYARDPAKARLLLRRRIHATHPPTELCLGMVKVAAKRITAPLTLLSTAVQTSRSEAFPLLLVEVAPAAPNTRSPLTSSPPLPQGSRASLLDDAHFMRRAYELAKRIPRSSGARRYELDRPIAAILTDAQGNLLAESVNENARDRTRHAELLLLQRWHHLTGRGLPLGARLYVTLKPCRMCAGALWHCAEDIRTLKVFYGEEDPGPNGTFTVLTRGTQERLRAARNEEERFLEIERKL